jgi:allantoin racemase
MYGLHEKLASIRDIEMPVLDLHKDEGKTLEALVKQGRKAIDEDGAQALILGCTGMTGMAEKLTKELGVHVLDPLPTAVKLVETLASLRLTQSKLTYPVPPENTMIL